MSSHGSTVTPQNGSLLRARSSSSESVFISSCFKIGAPYCILYWFQFLVWVITLFFVYLTSADNCHTLHFMNDQLFPSPPVKGSSAWPASSGLYQRASQLSAALSWPPVALCSHQLLLQLLRLSHQSCPTLCDPIDGSPPGSPVPGILQARTLELVAISFSNAWKWKVKVKLLSRVWLFVTP